MNPAKEIFLADSAYTKAEIGSGIKVRTPVPLPEDGSAPTVWNLFFVPLLLMEEVCQGPDLKKSHIVQSHRGLIERRIGSLKFWQILQGVQCDSICLKEKELDVAMSLENLILLDREGLMDTIRAKAPFAPGAHIITSDQDVPFSLPKERSLRDADTPSHVKEFYEDLTSHAKQIENWLWDASWEQSFSNRVEKRGDNLVKGGNMLQLSVHKVMDRVWIVRGNVGAAMKGVSYKSYVKITIGSRLFECMCECTAG